MAIQSSDRYEKKSGGGCLSIFGLPFLAAGLAVMIFGSTGKLKDDSGDAMPPIFAILFGGVFATVGGALVFGRSGVILDKRAKRATKWWGLLVPMKSTVTPMESFTQVKITKEIRRSDKSTYTVYPVRIALEDGRFNISEARTYQKAREEAEELAKFLELPLSDASEGGEARVREAGELDQSLRDQARAKGETVAAPPIPEGCQVRHELGAGRLQLEVPAPEIPKSALLLMGLFCLIPLGFFGFIASKMLEGGAPLVFKVFIGFFVLAAMLPLILGPGRMFLLSKSPERITVTPDSLEMSLVSPFWTKTVSIPAEEIEELELSGAARAGNEGQNIDQAPKVARAAVMMMGGGATIMARSDKQTLHFGRGLTRAEAEWMHALIKLVLTS